MTPAPDVFRLRVVRCARVTWRLRQVDKIFTWWNSTRRVPL